VRDKQWFRFASAKSPSIFHIRSGEFRAKRRIASCFGNVEQHRSSRETQDAQSISRARNRRKFWVFSEGGELVPGNIPVPAI
jgi:hypothetical protein